MGSGRTRVGGLLAAMVGAGLLLVAGILPQAGTAEAAPGTPPSAGGPTTVLGPQVWLPATGTYGPRGKVTVSQTTNLTDQVVHVSWSGFTPSVNAAPGPATSVWQGNATIFYPVRVYECRGLHPTVMDCYGSSLYDADPKQGFIQNKPPVGRTTPDFPTNVAVGVTQPDGTGQADIEVWTSHESPSLGCDPRHACSLVIEPNYGGDSIGLAQFSGSTPLGCTNHTWDLDTFDNVPTATDFILGAQDFNYNTPPLVNVTDGEQCAWNNSVAVPLSFAPTPADCQARAADFSVRGLEMANRMMQQWRSGLCGGTKPLSIQYEPSGGEPQARQAFLAGFGSDVALTAYPDSNPARRPYVYAPLANSGVVVAFRVDDAKTGKPITTMKLNARLLAKQLTQSYVGQAATDSYDSTKGNPSCIYADQEFLKLNPVGPNGPNWPTCVNGGADLPLVVGGTTDLVRQLTSWIAGDPDAAAFLAGTADPWGMHVNTHYAKPTFAGYPTDVFVPQDLSDTNPQGATTNWKSFEWNPMLGGLTQVSRSMLANTAGDLSPTPDQFGNHPKDTPQTVGTRSLMAIVDAGQAAAFSMPQAQLLNPAGSYVAPSSASFKAAVGDMATDATTGTAMLPYSSPSSTEFGADASAYPLTTVQYAMLPTHGVSATKVQKITQFLTQAGDPKGGQQPGFQPGTLAGGFLPLTADQRKQLSVAACDVQHQDGQKPGNQGGSSPCLPKTGGSAGGSTAGSAGGSTGGSGGTTAGGGSGSTGGSSGVTSGGTTAGGTTGGTTAGKANPQALASTQPVAVGTPDPNRVGGQRLLLPILLIAGGVLLVGGPATLVLTGTEAGGRLRSGSRRLWRQARGAAGAVSRRG